MFTWLRSTGLALLLTTAALATWAGDATTVTLPNTLRLDFPWDPVSVRVKVAPDTHLTVKLGEEIRPAQIEAGSLKDGSVKVWFMATTGRETPDGKPTTTDKIVATIEPGQVASPLTVATSAEFYTVNNGLYEFRIPRYAGKFDKPRPIAAIPPILGGVKVLSDAKMGFAGKGWFEGDAVVLGATTEIVEQGPVYVLVKVRFDIQNANQEAKLDQSANNDGAVNPTRWPPAERGSFYEATVRCWVKDPWIEVNEQYHIPAGATYWWQLREELNPDCAMWVRWFRWGQFGGNIDLQFHPLEKQDKQNGPFVMMRPRWNQMPGGGQDFLVTRGGVPKDFKPEPEKAVVAKVPYDPQLPAVGVVAAYPSRWTNPYAQTISAFAEDGTTARLRFPLVSGTRAYAVLAGPRDLFDQTGKLNGVVRRHSDWTLDKQVHQYILDWPRDPATVGPRIYITKAKLQQLQDDFKSGKDTPEMNLIREYMKEYQTLMALDNERAQLESDAKAKNEADSKIAKAKLEARKDEFAKLKNLQNRDMMTLALITGEKIGFKRRLPGPGLWLERRYQDDFLNPTQGPVRRIAGDLANADLFATTPLGGPSLAALAYIFSDLDAWPGWTNGWTPGNPNFHTDKYTPVIYIGAIMPDHPDAKKWLEFGKKNFMEDMNRVLVAPDGVGLECPGYSLYSYGLQLDLAEVFMHVGYENPIATNPLNKNRGRWHRNLITPKDVRLGLRHQAPIGDTHRWGAAEGNLFGQLAKFYKKSDPTYASELMGVWRMYKDQGMKGGLFESVINIDPSISPMSPDQMDWASKAYYGFGSIMRSRFGQPDETFVTMKAGPVQGHYHNDELSYHFYGAGTPLSLDYNCSYHPRGDHAALHNSMTFGVERPFLHNGDMQEVPAMEQLMGAARVGAFVGTAQADVVVAERSGSTLVLSPYFPDQAKFSYNYPVRDVPQFTHRRYLMLVKHPPGSKLADYLVVRDETNSTQRQQLNIHLLTRAIKQEGNLLRGTGQWDTDALVYLAQADAPKIEQRHWYYFDERMSGPANWGGTPEERKAWAEKIHATKGEVLIPPVGHKGQWMPGEYQQWLRIETTPKSSLLWVLYPNKQGGSEPKFETMAEGKGVRVSLNGETDEVYLGTESVVGQAIVTQNGKTVTLLKSREVPELGSIKQAPLSMAPASP